VSLTKRKSCPCFLLPDDKDRGEFPRYLTRVGTDHPAGTTVARVYMARHYWNTVWLPHCETQAALIAAMRRARLVAQTVDPATAAMATVQREHDEIVASGGEVQRDWHHRHTTALLKLLETRSPMAPARASGLSVVVRTPDTVDHKPRRDGHSRVCRTV